MVAAQTSNQRWCAVARRRGGARPRRRARVAHTPSNLRRRTHKRADDRLVGARDVWVSVGLMNPFSMTDGGQNAIAEAIERGERRVEALACGQGDVDAVAGEIAMDGRRARALKWTIDRDPRRTRSFFSMTELLYLGGGRDIDLVPGACPHWPPADAFAPGS